MGLIGFYLVFFGLPIGLLGMFITSICMYCIAKHRNKKAPGTYSDNQIRRRLVFLIVSSIIFGVFAMFVLGVIVMFSVAIAFM